MAVQGPCGPVRLKWHNCERTSPRRPSSVRISALGWQLGASLEVDILRHSRWPLRGSHDRRSVLDDWPRPCSAHADRRDERFFPPGRCGHPESDAPVLSLADLIAPLRTRRRAPSANLQLDLKLLEGHSLPDSAIADAAAAVAGLEDAIVVGSHHLNDARRLVAAIPGARLGYDPMLAVSRQPGLRDPEQLLRHMERRGAGVSLAYLRFDAIVAAEKQGFPLVARLLDLGIETDAWTVNPGGDVNDTILRTLVEAKVRQITTDVSSAIFGLIRAL